MKLRRVHPEMWVLGILAAVGILVGTDFLIRTLAKPAQARGAEAADGDLRPADAALPEVTGPVGKGLPIGSVAPEFELPDAEGKRHRLAELRGKPVVLAFYCGCARCGMMAQILTTMIEQIPGEKPHNLVVTSMDPVSLPRWAEKAEFSGTLLLEERNGPVATKYEGEPCPRVYVLDRELRVRHVTPSPQIEAGMQLILNPLAEALGTRWRAKGPPVNRGTGPADASRQTLPAAP